jgi:hypothetical protein
MAALLRQKTLKKENSQRKFMFWVAGNKKKTDVTGVRK